MENRKIFDFFPVGEYITTDNGPAICLVKEHIKGLKCLDLFSHLIMIYLSGDSFRQQVIKIDRIDHRDGIVYLNGSGLQGHEVFDIKPYFPSEDRVKDCVVPENLPVSLYHNLLDHENGHYRTEAMGEIRKIDGCFYLYPGSGAGIDTIREFSHVKVFWWCHRFDKPKYRTITECNPPYENAPRTGVFATRSPVRPNPIAVSTVRIMEWDMDNGRIRVSGMDCFDHTPLMDIIPYIPDRDRVDDFFIPRWLSHWPEWLDDRAVPVNSPDVSCCRGPEVLKKYLTDDHNRESGFSFMAKPDELPHAPDGIVIKGARQNNLKDIDVRIPYGKYTVVTGVSGSGKSSLVFDTLFAESQRCFMDSMSVSERSTFDQMEKPDVGQITGLPPAVAISQKSSGRNPRSTVGTLTDIHHYLSVLFSAIGTRFCPDCGKPVIQMKEEEIAGMLGRLRPGTGFTVRPFGHDSPEQYHCVPSDEAGNPPFMQGLKQDIHKLLKTGSGAVIVTIEAEEPLTLQITQMCYHCRKILFELTPSTFSFNNPESMCPVCKGLGVRMEIDPDRIITHPDRSALDGASPFWGDLRKFRENPNANWMKGEFLALAGSMGIDLEQPWCELDNSFRQQALYGSAGRQVSFSYSNKKNGRSGNITRTVEGAVNIIRRLFAEQVGDTQRIADEYMKQTACDGCHGERLSEGRMISIAGTRFPEVMTMTMDELGAWVGGLSSCLSGVQLDLVKPVLTALYERSDQCIGIGLPYLTPDRPVPTLSGGELQRIRLVNQLNSGISNILYVLDEPSAGLHPRDYMKLTAIIDRLKNLGNTVVVVEHNPGMMKRADYLIDIGPGAGCNGGEVTAEGTPEEVMSDDNSVTGLYLSGKKQVIVRSSFRRMDACWITLNKVKKNNLKNIDITFPCGAITCITGVSGSGKSSLMNVIYPAISSYIDKKEPVGRYDYSLSGAGKLENIIRVTQQPIGRTPRSNPATYTGLMDEIRTVFAGTEMARKKKYKSNKFSFNSKEGQCAVCKGEGKKCVEIHFMPDIWTLCPACNGKRYNPEALEVRYLDKDISDVLDMDVNKAMSFFRGQEKITHTLSVLQEIGLGYIKLGQNALTLSGGEAQRIKLAKELSVNTKGRTLYLLDEPGSGLHFSDIYNLLIMLRKITGSGNTVVFVEHNLDMIRNADWIIDLGPDGGNRGGEVIVQGTLTDLLESENSHTGRELKRAGPRRNEA